MRAREPAIIGPHICSGESGRRILWTHVGALWLVVVVSTAFFGWSVPIVLAGTVLTCVAVDLAMSRLVGSRNPASLPHAVFVGLLVGLTLPAMADTGWLLQIGVVGAVVASLVGKWIFGGMGHYVWHPALVGILAIHFIYPAPVGMVEQDEDFGTPRRGKYLVLSNTHLFVGDLSKSQSPGFYQFGQDRSGLLLPSSYQGWSHSVPSPPNQAWQLYRPVQVLQALAKGGIRNEDQTSGQGFSAVEKVLYLSLPPLADAIVGCTGGGFGETSVVAIILGGLYLIYRGYVRWQLPVSFLVASAIAAAVLPMPVGSGGEWVWFPGFLGVSNTYIPASTIPGDLGYWFRSAAVGLTYVSFHLCSGGLMLAAFFLANDMATRPTRLSGQIVFGLGAGVLTIVARLYGGWPMASLGAYGALLVMNTFSPLIDRLTRIKPPGR